MSGSGGRRRPSRRAESRRRAALANRDSLVQSLTVKTPSDISFKHTICRHIWDLGKRHRVGLDRRVSAFICRGCRSWLPSSSTIRIRSGIKVTTCGSCGRVKRRVIGVGE